MAASAALKLSGVHHLPCIDSSSFSSADQMAASAALKLSGVHHSLSFDDSSSVESVKSGAAEFADACLKSFSPPPSCVFRTCAGGSIGPDGGFIPCSMRLRHRNDNDHKTVQLSRGFFCSIHHPFIQCTDCEKSVHEGCWASACMKPCSRNLWTCDECARRKSSVVKSEAPLPNAKKESIASDNKATVLFKSRESLLKMFGKDMFRVRTSGSSSKTGLRWIQFECMAETRCQKSFKCRELKEGEWHVSDFPDTHACCPPTDTNYHEKTRTLPDDCLQQIQKLATSGAFDSKSIQTHLHDTGGWYVSTDLIYMIGYRARTKMFGGNGCSDTAHLVQQQAERRVLGDIYDLHFTKDGSLSHIVWVSSFAHLLVAYFDYFLCDGTHGISKYGWKFMPLCIVNSGDWIFPFAAVFGLEESSHSLKLLHAAIRAHCEKNGVSCPAFGDSTKPVPPQYPAPPILAGQMSAWARVWLRSYLYPLEWEPFIVLSTMLSWQSNKGLLQGHSCETCGVAGHNTKWCPKSRKDQVSQEEFETFFQLLDTPVSQSDQLCAALYASAIFKSRSPTLHTDGGSAFGPLCQEVDRERTSCAIHMESKVASCNTELKNMVKRLELASL